MRLSKSSMQVKPSTRIALGGLATAVCVTMMFLTGLIPFATYMLPALAGLVLIVVMLEINMKAAFVVYIAVSLLSVLMSPDKEAVLLFIFFFGYYPVIKVKLDKIKNMLLRVFVKLLIFNASVVCAYSIMFFLLGMNEVLDSFGDFGKYSVLILLLCGNLIFVLLDKAVKNLTIAYAFWFRPKFLKKL